MENNNSIQNGGGNPPKNYLVESILVTLFCCLPFGIMGIINATKVESKFVAGDIAGAHQSAAEAKKWMKYGVISGAVIMLIYFVFIIIAGGLSALS